MSPDATLDVRDVDGEPFSQIMSALSDLKDGETLELVNSFEPEPLYNVLSQRGFDYETEHVAEDEWRVLVSHV